MDTIKTISLLQPWASLLAAGSKTIETRSKNWSHRGPIAIHASARIPPIWRRVVNGEYAVNNAKYFIEALRKLGITHHTDLPRGRVIGIANLVNSYQFSVMAIAPRFPERAFGDFTPGRWGLVMENPRPLVEPIFAKGSLGLWNWNPPGPLAFADGESTPLREPASSLQLSLF